MVVAYFKRAVLAFAWRDRGIVRSFSQNIMFPAGIRTRHLPLVS